ncbi:hypothetical protein QFC20_000054 [Naganishia adeliensis]|uniref:Uncharacterized protein n=1 Tax=Naganishia adeliensis TaxID=92952 RepID=A0ACC2X404_9TREE|nr:hypothetical protein QFC20_000054 [Naganishia adeliensis]
MAAERLTYRLRRLYLGRRLTEAAATDQAKDQRTDLTRICYICGHASANLGLNQSRQEFAKERDLSSIKYEPQRQQQSPFPPVLKSDNAIPLPTSSSEMDTERMSVPESKDGTAKGYVMVIDEEEVCQEIKITDLRSCEVYLGSLSLWNKYVRSPRVFRINSSTVIVTWLVKVMSNDLPPITAVDLSYETVTDIQVVADALMIIKN